MLRWSFPGWDDGIRPVNLAPYSLTASQQDAAVDERLRRRYIVAIFILAFVIRIAYAVVAPPFQAPDEFQHFSYVKYVHDAGRLPIQHSPATDPAELEFHQPPLYYFLAAPLIPTTKLIQARPLLLLRLFNVLLAMMTIAVTYYFAAYVLNWSPFSVALTCGVFALLPTYSYTSATVRNGTLATLFTSLGLCLVGQNLIGREAKMRFSMGVGRRSGRTCVAVEADRGRCCVCNSIDRRRDESQLASIDPPLRLVHLRRCIHCRMVVCAEFNDIRTPVCDCGGRVRVLAIPHELGPREAIRHHHLQNVLGSIRPRQRTLFHRYLQVLLVVRGLGGVGNRRPVSVTPRRASGHTQKAHDFFCYGDRHINRGYPVLRAQLQQRSRSIHVSSADSDHDIHNRWPECAYTDAVSPPGSRYGLFAFAGINVIVLARLAAVYWPIG